MTGDRRDRHVPAYIGIGSNLDNPPSQVRDAFDALARIAGWRVLAVSSLWRSRPLGPQDQPDFCNAVAGVLTAMEPAEVLAELHAVEHAAGRVRDGTRWGPRVLDLDLLHVPGRMQSVAADGLALPHPGLRSRAFVLLPLAEIAPRLALDDGHSVAWHAAAIGDDGIERCADRESAAW